MNERGQLTTEFYMCLIAVMLFVGTYMYIVRVYQHTLFTEYMRSKVYVVGSRIATHIDEFLCFYSGVAVKFSIRDILSGNYMLDTQNTYVERVGDMWGLKLNIVHKTEDQMVRLLDEPIMVPTLMTDYTTTFTPAGELSIVLKLLEVVQASNYYYKGIMWW